MKTYVYWKERLYFVLSLIFTVAIYFAIVKGLISVVKDPSLLTTYIVFVIYLAFIIVYLIVAHLVLIGHLQGNAIRITKNQFPEIYNILVNQCEKVKLKKIPTMYLLQSGGMLNAFATKLFGRNYVVVYSDILEKAYSDGNDVVEFIISHELSHVKRNHLTKKILLLPTFLIFPLMLAYSRACEYTCDKIASDINQSGAINGLVLLSAGKYLYTKVNIEDFIKTAGEERSFAKWLAEKLSTHPHTSKRIARLKMLHLSL